MQKKKDGKYKMSQKHFKTNLFQVTNLILSVIFFIVHDMVGLNLT